MIEFMLVKNRLGNTRSKITPFCGSILAKTVSMSKTKKGNKTVASNIHLKPEVLYLVTQYKPNNLE